MIDWRAFSATWRVAILRPDGEGGTIRWQVHNRALWRLRERRIQGWRRARWEAPAGHYLWPDPSGEER